MLKELQWYTIAVKLRDFLQSYQYEDGSILFKNLVDRNSLIIRIGRGNAGEFPSVCILLGEEQEIPKQNSINCGLCQILVEICVKGGAHPELRDTDTCYRQIYEAENEFIGILDEFSRFLQNNGLTVKISPVNIISDEDTNAPATVQHMVVLEAEWHKNIRGN